jgi:hypothetical protein
MHRIGTSFKSQQEVGLIEFQVWCTQALPILLRYSIFIFSGKAASRRRDTYGPTPWSVDSNLKDSGSVVYLSNLPLGQGVLITS